MSPDGPPRCVSLVNPSREWTGETPIILSILERSGVSPHVYVLRRVQRDIDPVRTARPEKSETLRPLRLVVNRILCVLLRVSVSVVSSQSATARISR